MIEKILKKQKGSFLYGEVEEVNTAEGKVKVATGEASSWIKTSLELAVGSAVILGRNEDKTLFIVQGSDKALPAERVLLLV
jgi:hypothetical protein